MNKYTDKLDQLLKHHAFEDLSEEDKEFVGSEMSIVEYTELRRIVAAAKELNGKGIPTLPKSLQSELKQNLRLKHTKPYASNTIKWISPALGVLFGAFVMACWFMLSGNITLENTPKIKETIIIDTLYVQKQDTLYLPSKPEIKIITKEVIKYIVKEASKSATFGPIALEGLSPNASPVKSKSQNGYINNIDLANIVTSKVGTTIGEEKELMDLLQEMPSNSFKE